MELHRLDGLDNHETSGIDNLDIQDIDFEMVEDEEISDEQIAALEGLGYVHGPDITHEILDEEGNVVMYADDEENLYVVDGLGELGFLRKIGRGIRNASRFVSKKVVRPVSRGVRQATRFTARKVIKPVAKKVIAPAAKTFNRFLNPATILLRNGFLLAMKINLMNVAGRLRYGYLSTTEARRRGANISSFYKLRSAVSKAEKIYEGAGGKKSNLKTAILTGKGNSDRSVPLSGAELGEPIDLGFVNEFTDPFEQLVIESEPEEIEAILESEIEMEGLGAVATGSAIAAASGVVASVSAMLNKITGVFDKMKKKEANARTSVRRFISKRKLPIKLPSRTSRPTRPTLPVRKTSTPTSSQKTTLPVRSTTRRTFKIPRLQPVRVQPKPTVSTKPVVSTKPRNSGVVPPKITPSPLVSRSTPVPTAIPTVEIGPTDEKEGFFQKNKTVILVGAGVLVAGGGIYYAVNQSKKKKKKGRSLNGAPRDKQGRLLPQKKKRATSKKYKQEKLVPQVIL